MLMIVMLCSLALKQETPHSHVELRVVPNDGALCGDPQANDRSSGDRDQCADGEGNFGSEIEDEPRPVQLYKPKTLKT